MAQLKSSSQTRIDIGDALATAAGGMAGAAAEVADGRTNSVKRV